MSLKQIRIAKGLTQTETAEKANINMRTLQEYEQGRRDINGVHLKTLLKLCKVLGCKLTDILTDPELKTMVENHIGR